MKIIHLLGKISTLLRSATAQNLETLQFSILRVSKSQNCFFKVFFMTNGYPKDQNITSKIIYGHLSAFSQKQNLQSKLSIVQIIKWKVVTFGARNEYKIILYRQSRLPSPIKQIYSGLNIFEN